MLLIWHHSKINIISTRYCGKNCAEIIYGLISCGLINMQYEFQRPCMCFMELNNGFFTGLENKSEYRFLSNRRWHIRLPTGFIYAPRGCKLSLTYLEKQLFLKQTSNLVMKEQYIMDTYYSGVGVKWVSEVHLAGFCVPLYQRASYRRP